jgi:hypothetical protein
MLNSNGSHLASISARSDKATTPPQGGASGLSENHHRPWRIMSSTRYLKLLKRSSHGTTSYLFGKLVPKGSVISLVGEASAGKTVFLNRLCYALSTGETLLGITPPRPLKVLHVDVESPKQTERMNLGRIGTSGSWHVAKVDTTHLLRMLKSVGRRYDVIIVDSLMVASPVNDENSNAEANRQMLPFIEIARTTDAALVLSHNQGEGNPKEKFKSRGATARVDRFDEVINLDDMGGEKRRLKVVKSRFGNLGQTIEYELTGNDLNYRLTKALEQPATAQELVERRVMRVCRQAKQSLSRKQIAKALGLNLTSAKHEQRLGRALKTLTERRILRQPQHGRYILVRREP